MRLDRLFSCAALALLISGCGDDTNQSSTSGTGGTAGSGGTGATGGEPPVAPASPKANVKFKGGSRLQLELTRALSLAPNEICQELGSFDCFGIHNVALGGTDAVNFGIYEPLASTTQTTPLATERVVLAGCSKRAALDLAAPETAVVFKGLTLTDGKLADPNDASVDAVIQTLYQRILSRDASPAEVESHRGLYVDIDGSGISQTAAQDWAALSCMATFTTLEALFY